MRIPASGIVHRLLGSQGYPMMQKLVGKELWLRLSALDHTQLFGGVWNEYLRGEPIV
jgi:hypothetical protein